MPDPDYELLTVDTVPDYVAGRSALVERIARVDAVREVGDGNLNYVFVVSGTAPNGDAASLVVKQALPYVRADPTWPMSPQRNHAEARALRIHGRLSPPQFQSNTHCIARPGRPTNGSCITCRSYQRLTVTIGFASIRDACATMCESGAGTAVREQRSQREPRHGRDDRAGADGSRFVGAAAANLDAPYAAFVSHDARQGAGAHLAAALLDVRPRRFRVHLVQRPARQHHRRRLAVRAEHLRQDAHERLRQRLAGRLIQRRDGERLPQPRRQHRALPAIPQPAGHGRVASLRDVSAARQLAPGLRQREPHAQDREPIAERQARSSESPRPAGAAAAAMTGSAAPIAVPRHRDTAPRGWPDDRRCPSRRHARASPAFRDSSRTARAGRCRRARRSRDRGTPWHGRRAAAARPRRGPWRRSRPATSPPRARRIRRQ